MALVNVISFNKTAAGNKSGWCLQNTRSGFGIPSKYQSAWEAWLHTQQHTTPAPAGVDVPLFFWYKDEQNGHIGVRLKSGQFWSDGKIYNRVEDYLREHPAVKYRGWGESINDVRVLKYVPDPPKPALALPKIGSRIQLLPVDSRTTFKNGTTAVAGNIRVTNNSFVYVVRGYDKKYKNRVLINSASAGGNGVAVALYYTNGTRIPKWKQL